MSARETKVNKFALSWWVFLTFIPGLTFIPFTYAGFSSKDRKLVYFSYLYFLPLILGYYFEVVYVIGYIGGIVHAFMIRDKYIQRRIELKNKKFSGYDKYSVKDDNVKNNRNKKKIVKVKMEDTSQDNVLEPKVNVMQPQEIKHVESVVEKENNARQIDLGSKSEILVDINHCSEEELEQLPFINSIAAKKAIHKRDAIGSFASVEEFGISVGLKPHVIEKIRPLVIIKEKAIKEKKNDKGRVIDL